MSRGCKDLTRPTLIIYNLKITGLARRFFPETVLKQDTLLLYNPKECSEVNSLSRVLLFATPWTVAYQAPLSMGFSSQ